MRKWYFVLVTLLSSLSAAQVPAPQAANGVLRVCADPDNLPLSHRNGQGYENRIAEALAADLNRRVEYTWFPQRMGFVRNTLRARDPQTAQFRCDLIIGVPKGYELTATTRPYMRSTYALVFPSRRELEGLRTAEDLLRLPSDVLQQLRIGVFAASPGADWLLRNGLMKKATVYAAQSGDPAENPALVVERDLLANKIDLAIVWGPIAGHLVNQHARDAALRAVPFMPDPQIHFAFEISMGVRFGEKEWKETLDRWIETHPAKVNDILKRYGVPLLDSKGQLVADFGRDDRRRGAGQPRQMPLRIAGPL